MTASRKMVVCPACDGEGRITTGEWYEDRETGAHSPITEECDLCGGIGRVPETPIHTENVYPPIPMRQFDWCAYRDGYEPPDSEGVGGGNIGWGRTEADAIADLKDQEAVS